MIELVTLPAKPGIRNATPGMLDWGGRLEPILGGEVQTLLRLGTRFSLEFTLPPVRNEPDGREWVGKLNQAKLGGALARFVQDGFHAGSPGNPVVDGTGQSGMTLAIRDGTPNYKFRYGQFFSLQRGTRWYLYMVRELTALDANGDAELPIFPWLRKLTVDGDQLEIARPWIQGSLIGDERRWKVTDEPYLDLGPIRIDEDA